MLLASIQESVLGICWLVGDSMLPMDPDPDTYRLRVAFRSPEVEQFRHLACVFQFSQAFSKIDGEAKLQAKGRQLSKQATLTRDLHPAFLP